MCPFPLFPFIFYLCIYQCCIRFSIRANLNPSQSCFSTPLSKTPSPAPTILTNSHPCPQTWNHPICPNPTTHSDQNTTNSHPTVSQHLNYDSNCTKSTVITLLHNKTRVQPLSRTHPATIYKIHSPSPCCEPHHCHQTHHSPVGSRKPPFTTDELQPCSHEWPKKKKDKNDSYPKAQCPQAFKSIHLKGKQPLNQPWHIKCPTHYPNLTHF